MNLSRPAKRAVIIFCSALAFWAVIIILKNLYQSYNGGPITSGKSGGAIQVLHNRDTTLLPEYWKYHKGDDSLWSRTNINDSKWDSVQPDLNLRKIPENYFNGICWFRATVHVDQARAHRIYAIDFTQHGASEIYWDGKRIIEYGTVSQDANTEEPFQPPFPMIFFTGDTGMHTLAIRYSNQHYLEYFQAVYREEMAGIEMDVIPRQEIPVGSLDAMRRFTFAFILLFGFFLTLSIVHFLLYVFYRKQKQNLYYSLFSFSFSLCFLMPYIILTTTDPPFSFFCNQLFFVALTTLFLFLIKLLHSLFTPTAFRVTFTISTLLGVAMLGTYYMDMDGVWDILLSIYITFACIEFIRSIVEGIRHKLPGSKIIGAGVLIFALFISLLLIVAAITGNVSFSLEADNGLWLIVLVVFVIISIPLSMSIYLAYDFSNTNRDLSKKLDEVEALSQKTISQEKEKQEILSKQKETLEVQVKERTREVVEQKKVIEEKNKDITDSINYAKRIQDAILPSDEQVRQMLPESFVLFKPKDIVSGDFYFFAEAENKVIVAAVDCTGHGVPGAFMSMVGYNHLKRIVVENGIADTSKILDELHKQVLHSMNRDITRRDSKDGMDVSIVSIDKKKRELQFSGAVRPLYYFDSAGFHEVKGERYSIAGVKEIGSAPYASTTITVTEPTTFYLFSDGFADQFGGKDGKKLMSKNFRELLTSIQNKSMSEQKAFLDKFIEDWKSGREQMDDVMVIGIKI